MPSEIIARWKRLKGIPLDLFLFQRNTNSNEGKLVWKAVLQEGLVRFSFKGCPQYPQYLISRLFASRRRFDFPQFGQTNRSVLFSSRELPQTLQWVLLKSKRGSGLLHSGHLWYLSITNANQTSATQPTIKRLLSGETQLKAKAMIITVPDIMACVL